MLVLFQAAVPSQVHVKLRPHVQEFLESLSKTYEVPRPLGGSVGSPLGGLWGHPWGARRDQSSPCRDLPPLCQILIYTTAKKDYAKKLLEVLDPKKKLIR